LTKDDYDSWLRSDHGIAMIGFLQEEIDATKNILSASVMHGVNPNDLSKINKAAGELGTLEFVLDTISKGDIFVDELGDR
jgi:hypothetical protein